MLKEPVQLPAEALGAGSNDVAGAARSEFLVLEFFLRLETSISVTLFDGRISAADQIRPVSSSAAKSTFSISCSGSTSQQMP